MDSVHNNADTKKMRSFSLLFVCLSVAGLMIHSYVYGENSLDITARCICGVASCCAVLMMHMEDTASIRKRALAYPLILIIGEMAYALITGGDRFFYLLVIFYTSVGLLYLDHTALAISSLLVDIAILTLVFIHRIPLYVDVEPGNNLLQLLLLVSMQLVMYMFGRFAGVHYRQAIRASGTFAAMLEHTPNYVFFVDKEGRITNVSRSIASALGMEQQQALIGRPLSALVENMHTSAPLEELLSGDEYWEQEIELELHGERLHFSGKSSALGGADGGRIFELADITTLVATREEALAAAEAKSVFLAKISHEIRTPMNAIVSFSELLQMTQLDSTQEDYTHNITSAADSLLRIINDILDFSKIEAQRMELLPQEYDFSSLINDMVNVANIRAQEKDLMFFTDIDPDMPCRLLGDEIRIKQVLFNLISNASKYTTTGYIRIRINQTAREGDIREIRFAVEDTGSGISEDDLPKLFKAFAQVDKMQNRAIPGTGLGLAISKRLVEMMGGELTVISEHGVGSTFTVIIPQQVVDQAPLAAVHEPEKLFVLLLSRPDHQEYVSTMFSRLDIRCQLLADTAQLAEAEKIAASGVTHIFYLYEQWDSLLRDSSFYHDASRNIIAVKNIRDAIQQKTPPHINVLFEPVLISNVAAVLNGTNTRRAGKAAQHKLPLGGFRVEDAAVLVVDDNEVNLAVTGALFGHYNITPDLAQSGREALRLTQHKKYDIIFMDHMMPEMDGIEVTQLIQVGRGPNRDTPIVALTANAINGMREIFLRNGMADYLSKPIIIKELSRVLRRFIPAGRIIDTSHLMAEPEVKLPPDSKALEFLRIGIDYKSAMEALGGSPDSYQAVLRTFCESTSLRLAQMSTVLMDGIEQGDVDSISRFKIEAHALKSAAAGIGATALAQQAKGLELAAATMNTSFIREAFPQFAAELSLLLREVAIILDTEPAQAQIKPPGSQEQLHQELWRIRQLLLRLEAEQAKEAALSLAQYAYDERSDQLVQYVLAAIDCFRFSNAIDAIEKTQPEEVPDEAVTR